MAPNASAAMVMRTALKAKGESSRKMDFITIKFAPQMQTTSNKRSSTARSEFARTLAIIAQGADRRLHGRASLAKLSPYEPFDC